MNELEAEFGAKVMLELGSLPHCRLWRNPVGAVRNVDGRYLSFGLARGSADYIGIYRGLFLSIETKQVRGKTQGERRKQQIAWRDMVNSQGGIAVIAYGDLEALTEELEELYQGRVNERK